jgi:hypothetical protein
VPGLKPAEVCRLLERLGFSAVRHRGPHIQCRVARTAEDQPILYGALDDTLTVIAVPDSALEPLREDVFFCARALAAA